MKTTVRLLTLSVIGLFAINAAALAHGLHGDVEPRLHGAAHLLQLIGGVGTAVAIGFWMRRRARRARGSSSGAKIR